MFLEDSTVIFTHQLKVALKQEVATDPQSAFVSCHLSTDQLSGDLNLRHLQKTLNNKNASASYFGKYNFLNNSNIIQEVEYEMVVSSSLE